jgi:ubiquinone/menaquinone biosynthesis C-methylase UbiE
MKSLSSSYLLILSFLVVTQSSIKAIESKRSLPTPGTARPLIIEDENDFNKTLIEGWNAISPAYLAHKLTQTHPGELIEAPIFRSLIEKYAKNARQVLDAATGNGWFTTSVLKWNILPQLNRIVGIDISPAMIATARSQCSDHRAEFFCSPLELDIYESIGINQKSLDLIISSNAFDCIKNIDEVLARLQPLLKKDGYAIVSIRHPLRNAFYLTGNMHGDFEEGAYAERWDGTANQEVIRFFRKEASWDQLFKQYGFEIVEKTVPVIAESAATNHPEHYQYYKNKKHPGALIFVLRPTQDETLN